MLNLAISVDRLLAESVNLSSVELNRAGESSGDILDELVELSLRRVSRCGGRVVSGLSSGELLCLLICLELRHLVSLGHLSMLCLLVSRLLVSVSWHLELRNVGIIRHARRLALLTILVLDDFQVKLVALLLGHAAELDSVSGHAKAEALFQTASLASISVGSVDDAVSRSWTVVSRIVLLRTAEKTFAALAGDDAVVDSRAAIAAHFARDDFDMS